MNLLKIWAYLRGYLVIDIEGNHGEKLINMAVSRGHFLWEIRRVTSNRVQAKIYSETFPSLRHIARATGSRVRINSKKGIPFLVKKIYRRKMFPVGILFFLVCLYLLSSFIWSVEIKNVSDLKMHTEGQIFHAASSCGLKKGALRYRLDTSDIKESMERKLPRASWVGVEISGTRAILEVVEKVLPDEKHLDRQPGNILAQKDGIIEEILVLSGTAGVMEGDTVKKGDLLISGEIIHEIEEEEDEDSENEDPRSDIEDEQEEPVYFRAKGIVRARAWYEFEERVNLEDKVERKTGQSQKVLVLRIGKKKFIKGLENPPYKTYKEEKKVRKLPGLGNMKIPMEITSTVHYELKRDKIYRSMAEARDLAEKNVIKKIEDKLPPNSKIISKKTNVKSQDEKKVILLVLVETIEEIGEFHPLN